MEEKITTLKQNQTQDFILKPNDKKPIPRKWVYKTKKRPDGSVEMYKAWLDMMKRLAGGKQ